MRLRLWLTIQTYHLSICQMRRGQMVATESLFQALQVRDWEGFMIGYSAHKVNYTYLGMALEKLSAAIETDLAQIRSVIACIPLNLFTKYESLREAQKSLYT